MDRPASRLYTVLLLGLSRASRCRPQSVIRYATEEAVGWAPTFRTWRTFPPGTPTVAVGWLHSAHAYTCGPAPAAFVARLAEFARHWHDSVSTIGWGGFLADGPCRFCDERLPAGTFFVPAGGRIFWCRTAIAHYVAAHEYLPPAEFVSAVLACPVPGTLEYVATAEPFASRSG